jgi:hypothetical protein
MPSQFIADRSDPGVEELVGKWEDGKQYPIPSGMMTQTSQSPSVSVFKIDEIVTEESAGEEAAPAPAAKPAKPPVEVTY